MTSMPCNNMVLCFAEHYSRLVLNAFRRGEELKGLKSRLLELLIDPHKVSVVNVCNSLRNIGKWYYEPLLEALKSLGCCVVVVDAKLKSKLVVGSSSGLWHAVFEVGLSWNYTLDLPFIPASSLKGLIRSWLIHTIASKETNEMNDIKTWRRRCLEAILTLTGMSSTVIPKGDGEWANDVFGGIADAEEASAGSLIVADAYPVERGSGRTGCGLLDFDVITPHYYEGGEVCWDEFEAKPTPIPHLTVAPGVMFRFVVAVDKVNAQLLSKISSCLGLGSTANPCRLLSYILLSVLAEGVGARTSKGYGLFDIAGVRILNYSQASMERRSPGRLRWRIRSYNDPTRS